MNRSRTRVLAAAADLLATGGLRALTHVRVDERASLPKGSTSNYFRTRATLLVGVSEWIVEQEMPTVATAFEPRTPAELVDGLCALLDIVTRDNRDLTAARLVLFVEASHNKELREALSRGRAALEPAAVSAVAALGAPDPQAAAAAVIACFEGVVLHRVARNEYSDPRPVFDAVVRGALA